MVAGYMVKKTHMLYVGMLVCKYVKKTVLETVLDSIRQYYMGFMGFMGYMGFMGFMDFMSFNLW
jgi:hypothetical protein